MRKLALTTFLTLDGVMQAPGSPEEDLTGGFAHGGWSMPFWDEGMGEIMAKALAAPFDLLLGRKTYQVFAAHWPAATGQPGADELNAARKYVASRTLTQVDWNNSVLLSGDVAGQVADLKRQPGPEIQVHGSGDLAQTLLRRDLVDEINAWIFPIALGRGKRLFGAGTMPTTFTLREVVPSSTGVLITKYTR
ncbi:dihydrofolate reductase family protein [Actinokineospora sp. HUAS TT18]|uniref:dihydrofolate reductase family protein n=1 Tax=Actinokineospora sp. HUAS TT18 TaxID=3447451 RepID=UPI003F51AEA0